jgi:hypothetical protein
MRIKGIVYDTGFLNAGVTTKERFDTNVIKREMNIIKNDLHCNAVRITGGDADRLETAAALAASEGLEVWYCPFTCGLTINELTSFLIDAADKADRIRRSGAEVVFIAGSEISLFNVGFLKEETLAERLALITNPEKFREQLPQVQQKMKVFLADVVQQIRQKFKGKISYASLPFEGIDWSLFDFIATDAGHRSAAIAPYFQKGIQTMVNMGKPVAIMEFGCCTYRGAADSGARADWIIEWDNNGHASHLNNTYIRDEDEQAKYLLELLRIFETEKVDAVFVNTFARYDLPHRDDPIKDLDMASGGLVKVYENKQGKTYPDMPWEPKAAFYAISKFYSERKGSASTDSIAANGAVH